MYSVGPLVSGAMALQFFVLAAMAALSPSVIPRATELIVVSPWNLVREALWLVSLALNYALPAAAIALDAALRLRPGATLAQQLIGHHVFELSFLVLAALAFRESLRGARPGAWGPEGAGELRRTDLLFIGLGGAIAVLALPALFAVGAQTTAVALYEVVLGLAIAAPFTFRMLGFVLDELGATAGRRELGVKLTSSNGSATLALSDSGPGVPPDALPHLFEPFFSRKEKGTGLGLAIARRTIDAHGGRIAASCEEGAGMTFRIELPLGARAA